MFKRAMHKMKSIKVSSIKHKGSDKYQVILLPRGEDENFESCPSPDDTRNLLCISCTKMLDKLPVIFDPVNDRSRITHDQRAMDTFTRGSCRVCAVFFQAIDNDVYFNNLSKHHRFKEASKDVIVLLKAWSKCLLFSCSPSAISARTLLQFDSKDNEASDADAHHLTHTGFGPKLDSLETWRLAKHWLDECKKDHEHCARKLEHPQNQEPWFPTRVIQVDSPDEAHVRVVTVDRDGIDPSTPYVTLSHCWGGTETMKLTSQNFDRYSTGIPFSELPKLIADAVKITKNIGVRFLWVDKLCIIQDSDTDWRKEASLMEYVYGNGLCAIVALDAPNDAESILVAREPAQIEPFKLLFRSDPDGQSKTFYLYVKEVTKYDHPLIERGWCFQEKLLSPRSICFTRRQLHWECRQTVASEMFPVQSYTILDDETLNPKLMVTNPLEYIPIADLRGEYRMSSSDEEENIIDDGHKRIGNEPVYQYFGPWGYLVADYSKRKLTIESDKLIAFSGIARAMSVVVGEYLAGMWRCFLDCELLWEHGALSGYSLTYRPAKYLAPSWSWASLNGPVWYPLRYGKLDRLRVLWEIKEAQVELVDSNPFGQVCGGHLTIRAKVLASKWTKRPATKKDVSRESLLEFDGKKRLIYHAAGLSSLVIRFDEEDVGLNPAPKDIFFLAALREEKGRFNGETNNILGMVVGSADKSCHRYRRLGVFAIPAEIGDNAFRDCPEQTVVII